MDLSPKHGTRLMLLLDDLVGQTAGFRGVGGVRDGDEPEEHQTQDVRASCAVLSVVEIPDLCQTQEHLDQGPFQQGKGLLG